MVIFPALFAPFTIVLDSVLGGEQDSRWLISDKGHDLRPRQRSLG